MSLSPKLLLTSVGIAILLALASLASYAWYLIQPVDPSDRALQQFVIPKGQSISRIGERLAETGLIKHKLLFRYVVTSKGLANQIQAGSFMLSPSMSVHQIASALTEGTEDVWVTILEGWRAEEIAEYLEGEDLALFDGEEFLTLVASTEGQLFPDTYLVPKQTTASDMHTLLINTFEDKVLQALEEEISTNEKPFDQILVMASLVEREARDFEQMRHVAGILWNRIELGMPLQVDATLQYAKGKNPGTDNWWSPPSAQDKTVDSPYNTYANPGLPPAPIANPGLNAIKAALDPLEVDDVFYLHTPSGEFYFAQTLEEHNANVNRYLR